MLSKIIQFSIKNKLAIGLFTLLLIIWGGYSLRHLPVDALPDITNNQVQIITTAPTLAAQEVEQFVTAPIELSLSNLPDLVELRSISRFGLSVVTVVFKENVDVYFARQLISERLREAEDEIPPSMGKPMLAPVSTGLGEVYQYIIHPKKGAGHKYTRAELRTMQDWIVARQLTGTPGVAEVNSFGGYLKQYEVAVEPARLKSMGVSITELLDALEKNNQNTGGAYIQKGPNAYFIRGIGLVSSLEDIGSIVVKNQDGVPILVRDVATPRLGHAIRYGAMTRNGAGEVVGGIVMMLKGENSNEVVKRVKAKMETIQKSLPDDIVIEPFLDRTDLVQRAISTVEKNLIEGALIVIFVLVVFLGNLRAGLIVASVIPLAMLFAFGMMRLFGVSANLMSLGAIDFGLIVDGAVIVVEATMHHLGLGKRRKLTQRELDEEVFQSASKIRKSAAFGEIIILIVYIPILSLTGIEGKMFRPMAETVGFAILGALILSLTYVPMMSALVLPRRAGCNEPTFSDRMMTWLQRKYEPLLRAAIRRKNAVVAASGALLLLSIFLFVRMGGEFIPQLQEGDYAFHCILPQGASLEQSVQTSLQAQRILMSFPEVVQVVGKTGSAEIPTDPMPPEVSDLIIVLKPKKEWKTTKDYDELAQKMIAKLREIPGVFFEVNQPIQMRFNELMTGVRQDVAVKIFGEDLQTLADIAERVAGVIHTVPGASAPQVERISGLPQIAIEYNRAQLAGYGLNVADVNRVITAAFAGTSAGAVYENERKFDLVVRLDTSYRASMKDVANLYIPIPNGSQVPLSQVARISMKEGPAQVSREAAKRRVVVGFNVQGRDVQSVVHDIRQKLASFPLPTGYYFSYGGTFEHLQEASARLMIAVPVALLLIFVLLFFTFQSVKQALLIFTAIPMAAIGGVFALLLRGMPFSISAGIGFIALFGVAVLNGIVLIGTFNQLAKDGVGDVLTRVYEGTKIRLRPVLMTATVASLGFLPMALSASAGAEVQRPLATVLIGGLITATILTLIVLPLLYILFSGGHKRGEGPPAKATVVFLALGLLSFPAKAQIDTAGATRISFEEAYSRALESNLQIQSSRLAVERAEVLTGTYLGLPQTGIFAENEDIRPSDPQGVFKLGISQSLEWPGMHSLRRDTLRRQVQTMRYARQLRSLQLRRELQTVYYTLWYLQSKQRLWQEQDSFYRSIAAAARLRVKMGENAGLDSLAANAKSMEAALQVQSLATDIQNEQLKLQALLQSDSLFLPGDSFLAKVETESTPEMASEHPSLLLLQQSLRSAQSDIRFARMRWLPELSGRAFSQRLYGMSDPVSGYSVTVGMPLLGVGSYRSGLKAAKLDYQMREQNLRYEQQLLLVQMRQAQKTVEKHRRALQYYESAGLAQAESIIGAAGLAYRGGQIGMAEYLSFFTQAMDIRAHYLEALHQYNLNAIQLNYYLSK